MGKDKKDLDKMTDEEIEKMTDDFDGDAWLRDIEDNG